MWVRVFKDGLDDGVAACGGSADHAPMFGPSFPRTLLSGRGTTYLRRRRKHWEIRSCGYWHRPKLLAGGDLRCQ
jgi:hypothetical protein